VLLTAKPGCDAVWILFADLPPGHGDEWTRAHKTLTPTEAAFAKTLKSTRDSGFTPCM